MLLGSVSREHDPRDRIARELSIRRLPNGRWQAQYRPHPGGKQVTRTTQRKVDARRWLDEQTTALVTGHYVDPNAGRVSFGDYFERWAARQLSGHPVQNAR